MSPRARTLAWLEIHALRCEGRHGAYDGEQDRKRPFFVDLAVSADLRTGIARDALDATIDFAAIAAVARKVVAGTPRTLLERLASDVAHAILTEFPHVEEVRVRIVKPEPDGLDAKAEAAAITQTRPARTAARPAPTPSARRARPARRRARG